MDSISDPVFGDLEFNGTWIRELELTFLGQLYNIELIVEGNDDDEAILDEQRTAYKQLSASTHRAEQEVFKYYRRICNDYRARFGDELDARMPIIREASELSHHLKLTGVVFPMVMSRGEIVVGYLLECSWEPEHGLGVKISDDKVEVGTQDIIT